jgi:Mg-chelatase subunit ChlD
MIIVILLILGLSDMKYIAEDTKLAVIFLVDLSESISEEALKKTEEFIKDALKFRGKDQRVSLLGFADDTWVISPFGESPSEIDLSGARKERANPDSSGKVSSTDIAKALNTAWGIFPSGYAKRVVLISDGNETIGDALQAAREMNLPPFGVQIYAYPLYPSEKPEVLVERIDSPTQVKRGEPFNLEVVVHSNHDDQAEIRLFRNKFEVAKREVQLKKGRNRITFSQTCPESGTFTYEAVCRSWEDTLYDNNRALGLVIVSGKPKILLIDENEQQARYLARALEEEDISVEVRNGLGVPSQLSELQNYELIILSDVPATRLSRRQMEMMRSYVQDLGGGLMMLGGENSFGLGGYFKTPIEEILPVRSDMEKKRETPSMAMVLVIDKSGSMGGMKIELAKEAAKATVELLGRRDLVGVIAFDGSPHWIAEIHSAADKFYLQDRIASLSAGGGTNIYPALQEAYLALASTSAKLKHVILLSDGISQPGPFYDVVSSMRAERITVSTVAIGSGADVNLLSNIANWGGGRFYFTQDAYNIPQIFAKETVTASKSAIIDEPFVPQVIRNAEMLKGIDFSAAPFLLGYVATKPKPTAEVFLVSDRGDPILASWRYGLGKVAAFTSDAKNRWAADWLEWREFSKFWAQVVRDTMRKATLTNFHSEVKVDKGIAHLTVDALDDRGEFLNKLENDVTLIKPDLKKTELSLTQTAPGRYETTFPVPQVGAYFINITQRYQGEQVNRQVTGVVVSYPEEYLLLSANEDLLARLSSLSGGLFKPAPRDLFKPPQSPVTIYIELWPIFLTIALLLLLLDILLRRIDLRLRGHSSTSKSPSSA